MKIMRILSRKFCDMQCLLKCTLIWDENKREILWTSSGIVSCKLKQPLVSRLRWHVKYHGMLKHARCFKTLRQMCRSWDWWMGRAVRKVVYYAQYGSWMKEVYAYCKSRVVSMNTALKSLARIVCGIGGESRKKDLKSCTKSRNAKFH